MATYLAYVIGGSCRDTHADRRDDEGNAVRLPLILKQLWVQEELRRMGISAWCGTSVEFKRQGKRRVPDKIERPYIPNYLFIEMSAAQFFTVSSLDHVSPQFQIVPSMQMKQLRDWQEGVNEAHQQALRVDANSKAAIAQYKHGQALRALSGPLEHFPMWFERVVKEAHDDWPKIEVEVDVMGARRKVRFDPLDVRADA